MRKTIKKALSVVLSAAMVLTAGGVGTMVNDTSAKAASEAKFTAGLWSYGTFAGWAGAASATVDVNGNGEYTITAEATEALDDLFTSENATAVVLGNYEELTAAGLNQENGYEVVGKSIQINDGEEIAWPAATVEWDGEARMAVHNGWDTKMDTVTGVMQPIQPGDKITVTFVVQDYVAAVANFTAELWSYGTFAGWAGVASATTEVNGNGDYSITAEATEALDDLFTSENATAVVLGNYADLTAAGLNQEKGYEVFGKSIQINGGEEIAWPALVWEWDGEARMAVHNAWGTDMDTVTGVVQPIQPGDTITVNFTVQGYTGNYLPPEPSDDPSELPPLDEPAVANFTAELWSYGTFAGWAGVASATVDVNGNGDYSITAEATEALDDLFASENATAVVLGKYADLQAVGLNRENGYEVFGKSIQINGGEEIAWPALVWNWDDEARMAVHNAWNTDMDTVTDVVQPIQPGDTITVNFTVQGYTGAYLPSEPGEPNEPGEPDGPELASSYNAYLGFQTNDWYYRNIQEDSTYGLDSTNYNYLTQVSQANLGAIDCNITNATITDNGTYSVEIAGLDLLNAELQSTDVDARAFNMLFITTDIPVAMKGVQFSDVKVIIDGKEVASFATGLHRAENQDFYQIMAIDAYNQGAVEAFDYTMPADSMKLEFTVSGIDFEQSYDTETIGLAKGKTFTAGNFKYKVTKAATSTAGVVTKGNVEVTGLSAAGKKKASISVGTSVKKGDATYTIKSVAAGAFKGASKLKSVTLSKNIKAIKKNTFKNDKKLATLTLKAKLSSVAKNAFSGCKKTIKVKGTSAKANVKKLKKSGYKKFK